jgi:hypothetical protein|tara:strand:+ start:1502 stop:1888 length:387 start_codon:yes stop_codon:yes gene_type:complete
MLKTAKKLNLVAFILLPITATLSSLMAIEVDLIAVVTVFIINLIPIAISSLCAYFLLKRANSNLSILASVTSPILLSFSTSLWYVMRVINPVNGSPGIEHLALPQMILIGAIAFGLLSVILVLILERK